MIRDSGSQVREPFGKRTDTGRHDMEQQTQPGHQHQEGPLTNSRGMTTRWGVESSISRPPYTDSIAAPISSSTQLTGDRAAFIRGPDAVGRGSINRTSICIAVSLLGCSKAVSVDCYLFVSCFNQYIAYPVSSILVPFFVVGIVFCPVSGRLAFNLSLQTQKIKA